jgi:hypothetical protein
LTAITNSLITKGRALKAGRIKFVPADDRINDSARLRIELLDDRGSPIGDVELVADELTSADERQSIALFEFHVDCVRRKADYIERYGNREQVLNELREDLREWSFRRRRDRERWQGLGDKAVLDAKLERHGI